MHDPSLGRHAPSLTGISRREALALALGAGAALGMAGRAAALAARSEAPPEPKAPLPKPAQPEPLFRISLAQWSLHKALYAGALDHLDFPRTAKQDYGIDAVEYVNAFFKKKADAAYVKELKKRCDDLAVRSLLIMCDGEGNLGDPDDAKRRTAVENHRKWLDAAKALGCHSIRVNAHSEGTPERQRDLAADGLRRLCELAEPLDLFVIVENHGGLSSNGSWLAGVIKATGHKRAGTLPDFGNFNIGDGKTYDRYLGVTEMMPFAKGVSAKSHDFNAAGEETGTDYRRMLKIVLDAGYRGHLGIEYEGSRLSEPEGVRATKKLLEAVRDEMSKAAPKGK